MDRSSNSCFTDAVTQRAITQIANAAGYKSAETEAIEALTLTTKLFIQEIGKIAHAFAELSGRNEVNSFDIAAAVADYGQSINQLNGFLQQSDPLPFFYPNLPSTTNDRPIVTPRNESIHSDDIPSRPSHIPEFLPDFPARFTFHSTKDVPVVLGDVEGLRKRKFEQSRAVEAGLVEIQSAREARKPNSAENGLFGAVHEMKENDHPVVTTTAVDNVNSNSSQTSQSQVFSVASSHDSHSDHKDADADADIEI